MRCGVRGDFRSCRRLAYKGDTGSSGRDARAPMSSSALAEAIDANPDSVRRTLNRRDDRFVRVDGGKWGLLAT